jgi:two-component system, cell cycle sensor histidine kinase and response regulator CckA
MTSGKTYGVALDWFTRGGAVVVASVGLAVVCGWLFNVPLLKSVMPGQATMKVNSACAFVAAGVALWLLHATRQGSQALRIGRALSVIVIAVGGLTMAEYVFALDFGIDQIVLPDTAQAANGLPPGRMAPATALSFFMVGVALLTLKAHQPRFAAWPHWLVVPPLFISTLAIVGYAYGVSSLYEVRSYSSMAAHTALAFFILTLSILAADVAHGFARIATSDTAGGVVSRRLLPTIPLILFALGWVRLAGQEAGLYDTRFGTALMVLLSITVCTIAVASTGIILDKVDVTRRRAEGEVATRG